MELERGLSEALLTVLAELLQPWTMLVTDGLQWASYHPQSQGKYDLREGWSQACLTFVSGILAHPVMLEWNVKCDFSEAQSIRICVGGESQSGLGT